MLIRMRSILTVLCTLCTLLFGGTAMAQCNPGPGQVALYVDDHYRGRCVVRGLGDFPTAQSIGLPNDSITSIRLGLRTQVLACRDVQFKGTCETITQDVPGLGSHAVGNDAITSLKVQGLGTSTACVPGPAQVAFFIGANYGGDCIVRPAGSYPTPEAIGIPNDSVSSMKVGAGVQVIGCRDINYLNSCQLFTGDISNLSGQPIGNDSLSSARVQPRGAQDCKPGPLQVGFFMHSSFLGPCSLRDVGNYPNAAALGLQNDSMSSILVGQGAQVVLCTDANYGGDCQRFAADAPYLGNYRIGNDTTSSARVQRSGEYDCTAGPGQVALFANAEFIGPCSIRGIGDYPSPQSIGIPNDSLSSFMLGAKTQIVLCAGENYGQDCKTYTASNPHFGDDRIANDSVSSVRVQTLGLIECEPLDNQVAVFMHAGFVGPCVIREVGNYASNAAIGLDAAKATMSSIRVGGLVQACGCDSADYSGSCVTLTANVSYLGNLSGDWNDKIASMKVTARGAECKAEQSSLQGVREVQVFNCHSEMRSVHVWIYDYTNNDYADKGVAPSNWTSGGCGVGTSRDPLVVSLPDGHQVAIAAVDPQAIACNGANDPTISDANPCLRKARFPVLGMTGGTVLQFVVDGTP